VKAKDPKQYPHPWEADRIADLGLIAGNDNETYSKTEVLADGSTETEADWDKLTDAVKKLGLTREGSEATKSEKGPNGGWGWGEFLHTLLPKLPGADGRPLEQLSLDERAAYNKVLRFVKGVITGSSFRAHLKTQPRDDHGRQPVLVTTTLSRDFEAIEGFYVTRDTESMNLGRVDPRMVKWLKEVDGLVNTFIQLGQANPELKPLMQAAIADGEKKAKAKFEALRVALTPASLGTGNGNGKPPAPAPVAPAPAAPAAVGSGNPGQ